MAFDSLVEFLILLTNVVLKFHHFFFALVHYNIYYVFHLHFYFTDICFVRNVRVVLFPKSVYSWTDDGRDNSDNMGYYEWISIPNKNQWKTIAERYVLLWNLLNCIGSIYSKHIHKEKFLNTGSSNFNYINYKDYHPFVLLGCCDSDSLFTMVENGYTGQNNDGEIFRALAMKYHITHSQLDIPLPLKLPHDTNNCNFPYYFLVNEAFPLSKYLTRFYPRQTLYN